MATATSRIGSVVVTGPHEVVEITLQPLRRMASLRWCLTCGWEGVARNSMLRRPLPRFEVVPDDKDEDEAPWRGA